MEKNMTKEDKELLFHDLCARLPYGVIVRHANCIIDDNYNETGEFHYTKGYLYDICRMDDMTTTIIESEGEGEGYENICLLERTVPYLRPMSSMTEEEFKSLKEYSGLKNDQLDLASYQNGTYKCLDFYLSEVPSYVVILVFDWLNIHHFDYRGLIERGLALEATKGMYN